MAKYGFNEVIRAIIDNFKGLVIIEDYSDFMDDCKGCYINGGNSIDSLTYENRVKFKGNSAKDFDVVIVAQSIRVIPPRTLRNTDVVTIFKTYDRVDALTLRDFPDLIVPITAINMMVNQTNNRFAYCYYDAVNKKISGIDKDIVHYGCVKILEPRIDSMIREFTDYRFKNNI